MYPYYWLIRLPNRPTNPTSRLSQKAQSFITPPTCIRRRPTISVVGAPPVSESTGVGAAAEPGVTASVGVAPVCGLQVGMGGAEVSREALRCAAWPCQNVRSCWRLMPLSCANAPNTLLVKHGMATHHLQHPKVQAGDAGRHHKFHSIATHLGLVQAATGEGGLHSWGNVCLEAGGQQQVGGSFGQGGGFHRCQASLLKRSA